MKLLLALALLPCFAFADGLINGVWKGAYSYEDGRAPVAFELRVCAEGGTIRGTISEPNTFGDPGPSGLRARVEGHISGSSLRFRKTYDGSGGASHSVDYEGILSAGTMKGSWQILPSTRGDFEVTRDLGSEKDAGCEAQPVMLIRAL